MLVDATAMCEALVGLEEVNIDGVDDRGDGLVVWVSSTNPPPRCVSCGVEHRLKDRSAVSLTDLACFGRPACLVWVKRRWKRCCGVGSFTEVDDRIASAGHKLTTRAGRWATRQVGQHRRSVASVAKELGTDWHTVNNAVIGWGGALIDADTNRVGAVTAVGIDETLFVRRGQWRHKCWATSIVDVDTGQLIDMVEARTAKAVIYWFNTEPQAWVQQIRFGVLDMSGPYRKVFNDALGWVIQIADPFHVVRNANQRVDECRRRVQNATLSHRGRKDDPLYRIRRLLTTAAERLDVRAESKLALRLAQGDPHGEVQWAWEAKEAVRDLYAITSYTDAVEAIDELAELMIDNTFPPEVNSLGRTLHRWRTQITNWHRRKVSNGPTEGANNMIKLAKRIGFGFRNFRNYRIRALLYAGRPNWNLLDQLLPAQIR